MPKGLVTKSAGKHYEGMVSYNKSRAFPDDKVYTENSSFPRHRLKERLIRENKIPYSCQECSNEGEYNGKKLSLQLDHINGVNNDNRLNNLRFLCPNCHTQQDTYAGKNINKNSISQGKW
jgi:5-methylcytosine-specific restriction endonuclease McrA